MVVVRVSPFIKNIWLMATPVMLHKIKRGQCFFCMCAAGLRNNQKPQNKSRLKPMRKTLSANGFTSEGDMIFTKL